jgi:hypothetical protein
VVLQEKLHEFLLMSPLDFVVELDRIRLVGRTLGRSALGEQYLGSECEQDGEQ